MVVPGEPLLAQSLPSALWSNPLPSALDIDHRPACATTGLGDTGPTCETKDMRRAVIVAWLVGLLLTKPLRAQEGGTVGAAAPDCPVVQACPVEDTVLVSEVPASTCDEAHPSAAAAWQAVWGLADLHVIPAGPKVAPNGLEYHPNFSMELSVNGWLWRSQRLYLFADACLWGERGENGVTNARDGFFGTSKREVDLTGGVAWNYAGPWEARAFGYSLNNLNRGNSLVAPTGFNDGFGLENRYYLSPEYAKLGQTGFDVARATFVSVGYYPTKDMVGNDGQTFKPGLLLRAYLIYDLWDWPCYAFGDVTYISERSLQPRLLLFDVGLAARPFSACQQCEFRFGAENTADLQVHNVQNLWYVAVRYIF
jgi:hypothetical protein